MDYLAGRFRQTGTNRQKGVIVTNFPTHEFFCHKTGEIFGTSQFFYFCPSCGQVLDPHEPEPDSNHAFYPYEN